MALMETVPRFCRPEADSGALPPPPAANPAGVIPANRVIALQTPVELGTASCASPRVELQRQGQRVVAIHVFCRCGEQITLECDLENG